MTARTRPSARVGLALIAVLAAFPRFVEADEVVTLVAPQRPNNTTDPILSTRSISLEEGDLCEVLYGSPFSGVDVRIGGDHFYVGAGDPTAENLPTIAGPAVVRSGNGLSTVNKIFVTFRIVRKGELRQPTAGTQVVIPADADGSFNVVLESSIDMINWVSVPPGVYPAEDASRFFRIRMEKVPE